MAQTWSSEERWRRHLSHPLSPAVSKKSKQEVNLHPTTSSLPPSHPPSPLLSANPPLTGMDVEGIYRKSGGNSQVQAVRDAFERNSPDFDLSDSDLDIHAITSSLKQYLRKLPNPLITYDVYDLLLETPSVPDDANGSRVEAVRESLRELPKCHYDVLEYLMRHLTRVVEREQENLMSSMNIAVVFAPTIMRPESLGRELTDTKNKNEVVMWLVDNVGVVFG